MDRDLLSFCRELPKIELHAHLNGSLSQSTMLALKRHLADSNVKDQTDTFFDKFHIAAGDTRSLSDCFQVFSIAHSLTTTCETLSMATTMTLQEFQDDGCCYLELRSTPRNTSYMNKDQYIETIIQSILKSSINNTMISKLILSIDRRSGIEVAEDIVTLAIEKYKKYPNVVVGIELSGDPTVGSFRNFVPTFKRAKYAGLKITLHCGEISNPQEILEMLKFKPDRIGHGTCIHPRLGGSQESWSTLVESRIPIEVCLTSNVYTKSCANYESHPLREMLDANIPIILCTDDKGVFSTSLTQEYRLCGETFNQSKAQLARISLNACQYVFDEGSRKDLNDKLLNFINKNSL